MAIDLAPYEQPIKEAEDKLTGNRRSWRHKRSLEGALGLLAQSSMPQR